MKRLFVLGLILGGILLSFYLIPSQSELAMMYWKGHQYKLAKFEFEKQSSQDKLSISVVIPLVKLYVYFGEIDKAVRIMEQFVRQKPKDLSIRLMLGKLYKDALMTEGYYLNLEEINRLHTTEENLREICRWYEESGQTAKKVDALIKLIQKYPGHLEDYMDLAYFQAQAGDYAKSVKTLERVEAEYSASLPEDMKELQVSLLLDMGKYKPARARAQKWLSRKFDPLALNRMVQIFQSRGQGSQALPLMKAFETSVEKNPKLLVQFVNLQMENGQEREAVARMERLFKAGRLSEPLIAFYREQAIKTFLYYGDIDRAIALMRQFVREKPKDLRIRRLLGKYYQDDLRMEDYFLNLEEIDRLQPAEENLREIYSWYVLNGRTAKQIEVLKKLIHEYPGHWRDYLDLAYFQAREGNYAESLKTLEKGEIKHSGMLSREVKEVQVSLLLDMGKHDVASGRVLEWFSRDFDPLSMKRMVQIFQSRGQDLAAYQLLLAFESSVEKNPQLLVSFVNLQIKYSPKKETLARLEKLFNEGELPETLISLLIELAMEGRQYSLASRIALVVGPDQFPRNSLVDLMEWSLERNKLRLIQTLLGKFGKDFLISKPLLGAKVMAKLDKKPQALRWIHLAARQPELSIEEILDLTDLYSKLDSSNPGEPPLFSRRFQKILLRELWSESTSITRMETLVNALLNLREYELALPYQLKLVNTKGGEWVYSYEKSLMILGRESDLDNFWFHRLKQIKLSPSEKRDIAFHLLDIQRKQEAQKIFQELAESAPPVSQDVKQLIFLWGPRPEPENINWLMSRAKASRGEELAQWMRHLISAGAVREAVDVTEKVSSLDNPRVFAAYLEALELLEDKAHVTASLEKRLRSETDPDRLYGLGKLAESTEQYAVAEAAFRKVLKVRPEDPRTVKAMGLISYYQNHWEEAETYLERYLNLGQGDWETHYYYAETSHSLNKDSVAQDNYSRALQQIEAFSQKSYGMRMAQARCLQRLGRKKDAANTFDGLIKDNFEKKTGQDHFPRLIYTGQNEKTKP
ncbi:MAG: tetratricopeptide repeat protein [Nitrospinaceae bacterium]